ncbi:MAG: 4-alpha-glucanotransferase [Planctomycetales bacterium]|nr:4-alpha-glucanotransferase [Planctomycetales bacterium]
MRFHRSSGILLHITSLPSRFGVGDFGPGAVEFVNFLERAGQHLWQVLPLGPPALGNSPYSCYSAFAGNPALISPEQLAADGWVTGDEVQPPDEGDSSTSLVNYETVAAQKVKLLESAYSQSKSDLESDERFDEFCQENAFWLHEFARFEACMRHFDNANWTQWPRGLVHREQQELAKIDDELADQIRFSKFSQFIFDQQWRRIKGYANDRGIRIFGDMPIFVAHESADVWVNQSLFELDDSGQPAVVAGVPPDYFSKTGQRWGNPLYRWKVSEATGHAWWTQRFRFELRQFDLLRVDHFRGFESYWEIPADAETAVAGKWRKGPMEAPFKAAEAELGELPIIAEDLGAITDKVHQLRDSLGFPAMRVLQFGFETKDDVFHRPGHYPEHSVAYTGTHDNDTLMGWYSKRLEDQPDNHLLDEYITGTTDIHLQLIKLVFDSASDLAIVPMQDVLGLGSEARMNIPGEADGNWAWRIESADLKDDLAMYLATITKESNRCEVACCN